MDAHALLISQGWRGPGHSIHPTSDETGLSHRLLVSKKSNTFGVGKRQHRTSDMWWMNAFDESLKGLDTTQEGKVMQTMTNGGLGMVASGGSKFVGNNGGLYASFVKGESLTGTITPEDNGTSTTTPEYDITRTITLVDDEKPSPPKRQRRNPIIGETKEQRRAGKAAKCTSRAHRHSKLEAPAPALVNEINDEVVEEVETKEQRMERRRQRKLRRQKKNTTVEVAGLAKSTRPKKRKKRQKE